MLAIRAQIAVSWAAVAVTWARTLRITYPNIMGQAKWSKKFWAAAAPAHSREPLVRQTLPPRVQCPLETRIFSAKWARSQSPQAARSTAWAHATKVSVSSNQDHNQSFKPYLNSKFNSKTYPRGKIWSYSLMDHLQWPHKWYIQSTSPRTSASANK